MQIYLRFEDGTGAHNPHLADLEVAVEPSHTVGDVADAVAGFLRLNPAIAHPLARIGGGTLDERLTMAEAAILSGETLTLGPGPTRSAGRVPNVEGRAKLSLVVASGPDLGRSLPLRPGTYVIGRDHDADLRLSDPQVSRRHLDLIVDDQDRVWLKLRAFGRNQVRTAGHELEDGCELAVEQVVRVGATSLVVRRRPSVRRPTIDAFGQVPFHRTPYFPNPVRETTIDAISDVPSRPDKSRFAYLSALLPVVMGVGFALAFNSPRYLMFALFSPVMLIGNHFEQRRRTGTTFTDAVRRFDQALEAKAAEVDAAVADERRRRFAAAPDVADLADRATTRSEGLWIRDRTADDFLQVRVGLGDLPAALTVNQSGGGDPQFQDRIVETLGETEIITDVPVSLDLARLGVVGLVGAEREISALASSLAVQATCLHSPEDLVVMAALDPRRGILDWLKWSPHSRSTSSPLAGSHLAATKTQADGLLTELLSELAARAGTRSERGPAPWMLLLLDRSLEPDPAIASRVLDAAPAAGLSVLWMTDGMDRMPRQAQAVVHCHSPRTGRMSRVSYTDPARRDQLVDMEQVSAAYAGTTGRVLAPLRDASSANAATALPRVVALFTAMGIESVDHRWVQARWAEDRGHGLRAPIGYAESGPLILDLVEHGPHGLIGGTSGAGKSELVMAMVAGLMAYNPPTRVNFLFIDYKGGASSEVFRSAPHAVGFVTNLDAMLARRALTSLRAELHRRMNLMQGRAKDLAEMIAKHPDDAPPSLVIVVDEFATLVKEIPDFVSGIVDIAQRGRSLGIHLLLATQRPSGSVNDNIKANTNLRISLRMLDGAESAAVIGSADAASIPTPLKGRGFAKMGSGEVVAFQSAWAGAALRAESGPPPVVVTPFGPTFPSSVVDSVAPASVPGRSEVEERTQLDALLEAVTEAADRQGLPPGRAPWLDALPSSIPIAAARDGRRPEDDAGGPTRSGTQIVFGVVDDPASQSQYPAVTDLAGSGGLIVTGTGGSGKSTLLRTIAVSAAMDDSEAGGGTLTIFAIDFASRALGDLARLPQCGAVAGGDDLEAVTRIVALLHDEFERRRQCTAENSARETAEDSARETAEDSARETAEDSARETADGSVLLLIDGMEGLMQTMEQATVSTGLTEYYTKLMTLITEGRQVGIFPVLATARRATIRSTVSAAISDRLTLRQADAQGYAECGLGAAEAAEADLGPGQGFFNGRTMVQVATAHCEHGSESSVAAPMVGHVDPRLRTRPLPRTVGLQPSPEPHRPVVGLSDFDTEPFALDLTYDDVSIVGDPRSGRSTALATIARQAAEAGSEVWILGPPGSPLRAVEEAAMACFDEGQDRHAFLHAVVELASLPKAANPPPLFLLDDHDRIPESDSTAVKLLTELMTSVRHVVTGPKPRGFTTSPLAQQVRSCRSMVYLRPHDAREAHELLGVPVPWHPGLPMAEGRGVVMVDRVPTIVQFSNPFPV